ncbi:flagellar export protein FliJ [Desulfoplanes sp.]
MSRPFVFKLASILRYRVQQEEQAQMAFSQAKARYERQGKLVRDLAAKMQECGARFTAQKTMTQADLWLWGNYREGLHKDHEEAQALLGKYARDVEKKRTQLTTSAKNRKLLEKFKSNQAKEHEKKERTLEQKEFDETATLRFAKTYS